MFGNSETGMSNDPLSHCRAHDYVGNGLLCQQKAHTKGQIQPSGFMILACYLIATFPHLTVTKWLVTVILHQKDFLSKLLGVGMVVWSKESDWWGLSAFILMQLTSPKCLQRRSQYGCLPW